MEASATAAAVEVDDMIGQWISGAAGAAVETVFGDSRSHFATAKVGTTAVYSVLPVADAAVVVAEAEIPDQQVAATVGTVADAGSGDSRVLFVTVKIEMSGWQVPAETASGWGFEGS